MTKRFFKIYQIRYFTSSNHCFEEFQKWESWNLSVRTQDKFRARNNNLNLICEQAVLRTSFGQGYLFRASLNKLKTFFLCKKTSIEMIREVYDFFEQEYPISSFQKIYWALEDVKADLKAIVSD